MSTIRIMLSVVTAVAIIVAAPILATVAAVVIITLLSLGVWAEGVEVPEPEEADHD